jgi:hypothetical protein
MSRFGIFAYGVLSYLVFFAVFLYGIGFRHGAAGVQGLVEAHRAGSRRTQYLRAIEFDCAGGAVCVLGADRRGGLERLGRHRPQLGHRSVCLRMAASPL